MYKHKENLLFVLVKVWIWRKENRRKEAYYSRGILQERHEIQAPISSSSVSSSRKSQQEHLHSGGALRDEGSDTAHEQEATGWGDAGHDKGHSHCSYWEKGEGSNVIWINWSINAFHIILATYWGQPKANVKMFSRRRICQTFWNICGKCDESNSSKVKFEFERMSDFET